MKFMALDQDAPNDKLHDQMRSMMNDDDDDDLTTDGSHSSLVQTGDASDSYMQESSSALTEALGPRWDERRLILHEFVGTFPHAGASFQSMLCQYHTYGGLPVW